MINAYTAKCYCCEDISLIENYKEAIADEEKMWDVHHRRECDENGKTLFTCKQLIEMDLYYHRPASELIFVTRSMHKKIHREDQAKGGKIGGKIAIKKLTLEQRLKGCKIGGKIGGGSEAAKKAVKEKCSIPILQFSKDGTFIKEWPSATEAGRQLGIHHQNICCCLKGRYKTAGGFVWRYK